MNTARHAHIAALAFALATTLSIFAGVADLWTVEPAQQLFVQATGAVTDRG
ncbi:hypothetical protein [Rubrivivax albus]|uniref:hypothetical protein n=1 Tax=Rubrivivax albus TaxID=2499835 RepID=UPI0013052AF8|nr:hypothetical protein [Rubrivivax albus]